MLGSLLIEKKIKACIILVNSNSNSNFWYLKEEDAKLQILVETFVSVVQIIIGTYLYTLSI